MTVSSFRCHPWLNLVLHVGVVFVLCFRVFDVLILHHFIVPNILLKCRSNLSLTDAVDILYLRYMLFTKA